MKVAFQGSDEEIERTTEAEGLSADEQKLGESNGR
jgi:hypothetical protein